MDGEPGEGAPRSLVDLLVRARHLVVAAMCVALSVAHGFGSEGDWPIFRRATYLLFGREARWLQLPGGLRMFANYPELQIGPVSVIVAAPFVPFGTAGRQVAAAVLMALGVVAWAVLDRTARSRSADPDDAAALDPTARDATNEAVRGGVASLLAGVLVVVAWVPLAAGYLHVDDAVAMLAAVVAIVAIGAERPVVAGVLLGAAVGSKPWAVLFAPMLLALPTMRPRAVAAFVGVAALCWAPFVIAEPSTLSSAKPTVDVAAESVLHLFGVARGLAPDWVRAPQLLLGLVVGLVAVLRGRWVAVPMVAIATRLVLEPGVFTYYASGLVLAAAAWDLLAARRRVPWATAIAFVGLDVIGVVVSDPTAQAVARLVTCLALVALGLTIPSNDPFRSSAPMVRAWGRRVLPAPSP